MGFAAPVLTSYLKQSKGGENLAAENTRILLVAQMKRVIEILEDEKEIKSYSPEIAEIDKKLHEIRRDSIRFIKELRPWN